MCLCRACKINRNTLQFMLNIDQLRHDYDKPFLELVESFTMIRKPKITPVYTWYNKNNYWCFDLDVIDKLVWIDYVNFHDFFIKNYFIFKEYEIKKYVYKQLIKLVC